MKGIYFDGERAVFRMDLPVPEPSGSESLIRILFAGVCSTDREVLKGYRPDFRGVMGHEFVGVVEASPDPAWTGKTVVGELNAGCGHCLYCRTGREKHCRKRRVIGMDGKDGCFGEYMTLETHLLHEVPEGLSPREALLTEPLAAALEITKQIHIDPDSRIAVIGDGRLAYLITSVLHLTGAELVIIGKHPEKLANFAGFGRRMLDEEAERLAAEIGGDEWGTYETVVEVSGSPSGLALAMEITRRQGTILLKSTYAGQVNVDMSRFVVNEITLVGSRCGPFEPALRLLKDGLVKLPPAVFYELADYERAFYAGDFKAAFQVAEKDGAEEGEGIHGRFKESDAH